MSEAAEQVAVENEAGLIMPDFSEVRPPVEDGVYQVVIAESKVDKWTGKEGKKDTYYIGWTFDTINEKDEKNNGRKIFHNTPITGPGAFKLQDLYKAAMGEECPKTGFDRVMLHGLKLEVTYGRQKNNPEYGEVKSIKRLASEQ